MGNMRSLIGEKRPAYFSGENDARFMGFAGLLPGKDAEQGKISCRCKASLSLHPRPEMDFSVSRVSWRFHVDIR